MNKIDVTYGLLDEVDYLVFNTGPELVEALEQIDNLGIFPQHLDHTKLLTDLSAPVFGRWYVQEFGDYKVELWKRIDILHQRDGTTVLAIKCCSDAVDPQTGVKYDGEAIAKADLRRIAEYLYKEPAFSYAGFFITYDGVTKPPKDHYESLVAMMPPTFPDYAQIVKDYFTLGTLTLGAQITQVPGYPLVGLSITGKRHHFDFGDGNDPWCRIIVSVRPCHTFNRAAAGEPQDLATTYLLATNNPEARKQAMEVLARFYGQPTMLAIK